MDKEREPLLSSTLPSSSYVNSSRTNPYASSSFAVNDEREPPSSKKPRVLSLDVLRGVTIACMILVNSAPDPKYVPLQHSAWDGVTLADFVFPFFVFMVGCSMGVAFDPVIEAEEDGRGQGRLSLVGKALSRTLKLIGLGIFVINIFTTVSPCGEQGPSYTFPNFDFASIRIPGVLQRIGICYFIAALTMIFIPRYRNLGSASYFGLFFQAVLQWMVPVLCLIVYSIVMYAIEIPGCGRGQISPVCNAAAYVDRNVWGLSHMYDDPTCKPLGCPFFDPEGIMGDFTAVATLFLGLHVGRVFRFRTPHADRFRQWIPFAIVSLIVGVIFDVTHVIPWNKNLWSPSYVFFMAGCSTLFLSFLYLILDVWAVDDDDTLSASGHLELKSRADESCLCSYRLHRIVRGFFFPFRAMGMNAIILYVGSEFVPNVLSMFYHGNPSYPLYLWLQDTLFIHPMGALPGSCVFGIAHVLFWLIVGLELFRRKIFVKL